MAYIWTVRTVSGATAFQIVHSSLKGSREIEHLGSAHDADELATLKAAAQQRIVEVSAYYLTCPVGVRPDVSVSAW